MKKERFTGNTRKLKKPVRGGCFCTKLRFELRHEPIDAGFCHCENCRRSAGAPLMAWATFPIQTFRWVRGKPRWFASSGKASRAFCSGCGTHLVFRYEGKPSTIDVNLVALYGRHSFRPMYHIWTASRIRWLHLADALPRHSKSGPDHYF